MNISSVVPSSDTVTDTMTDFEKVDRVRRSSADTCCIHAIVLNRYFPYWKLLFLSSILKQLLLRNCAVDFVEICNVYIKKMIIKAVKMIFNSGKICRSYSDLNFGVTFLEHSVVCSWWWNVVMCSWKQWEWQCKDQLQNLWEKQNMILQKPLQQ